MDYLFDHSSYENAGEKVSGMEREDTIKYFEPVEAFNEHAARSLPPLQAAR